MEAFQDSVWERKFAELAVGVASVGCSAGGGLEAVRSLPACKRGRLLQRHALVALLKRAIPGHVRAPFPFEE